LSTFINIKHQFSRYTTMMNQEDIFKKIGQILNELNEQYQYLAQNPAELNELELELFLANSSFLSDHVQIVRKLNSRSAQKALPEHASADQEVIEQQPVIPVKIIEETAEAEAPAEIHHRKPDIEEEIFKIDKEPSTFEFILNDKPSTDRFEFEEKSIDEIFDRPLSKEEEQIIAQKQKLRELDSLGSELPEEDEIGPEPFLVSEPFRAETEAEEGNEEDDFAAGDDDDIVSTENLIAANDDPEDKTFEEEEDVVAEAHAEQDLIEGTITEEPVNPSFSAEAFTAVPEAAPLKEPAPVQIPDFLKPVLPENSDHVTEAEPEDVKPYIEPVKQSELFSTANPAAQTPATPSPAASTAEEHPKAKPTLNDILSGNTSAKSFGAGTTRMPVTDLKQAISLNDKMRYIKDLFNGYNLAYAEAIDLLNKMPDFKTADAFLQNNYAVKNNWAAKQETAEQFYELLNQRFPVR